MDTFVINLQKCSIHDGPGIRSTVFFKGCPLKCVWCHNPESQAYTREVLYNEEKCSRCEACIKVCPHGAIYKDDEKVCLNFEKCDQCETCLDYCINNAREIAGTVYTAKELVDELYKDRMFYEESGGGVTLSGGEVMAQDMDYIIDVARRCKGKGFHLAIDTCGFAKTENYENILEYADLFLYDMKVIDNEKHIKFTGKSNELILKNLEFLSNNKANINIRIPLIVGVNVDDDNLEVKKMIDFLKPLNIKAVSLLPYHNIGKHKYSRLYKTYEGEEFEKPSDEKMEEIKDLFEQNNFDTKIGG
ncbi:glycyl-radical enzyme activating protein [Clostridioides mangenotii]|uniref:trans-4-hydroxy-L-proline dehydratase activase n=1 Tax=Metaclostridioides mangenotii TaxID=1540 RepID=UPI001C0F8B09|nr:trans-4-hydroxy-L-proline dehydratase activase [Clostridioides mangenotii]MBU5307118.1 glycyl-radical enzyme activating protein [Clostridioides mangenotii]